MYPEPPLTPGPWGFNLVLLPPFTPGVSGSCVPATSALSAAKGQRDVFTSQVDDYANFAAAQASYLQWALKMGLINQDDG